MTKPKPATVQIWLIVSKKRELRADYSSRRGVKYNSKRAARVAVSLISLILMTGTVMPATAKAGVFSDLLASVVTFHAKSAEASAVGGSLQTMPLLKPAMNFDPAPARGGGEITIVDGSALRPEEGPSGTIADIVKPKNSTVSIYVVREGDTLSAIAEMFGVSPNTILWANNLKSAKNLQIGQTLVILPVTGVKYMVKKGDTLSSIAKRFDGDAGEIASFNGIAGPLAVGDEIIIPDGEIAAPPPSSSSRPAVVRSGGPSGTLEQIGYYLRPIVGGKKSQGLHGYNGVDIAAPRGTPILASASGDVIVSREGGWNGGYGNYIVIQHDNGSQTLYSHNSSNVVYVGQSVVQGQVIGYVGASGKATGSHVHFEIRNGIRNPF